MYCPNCGSNNRPEISFCTRCGTSLAAVSEALARTADDLPQQDEQMSALLRRYYAGRHKILLGTISLTAGVALVALLFLSGKWSWLFWVFFWAFIGLFSYGARNFTKGWHLWSTSSVELKALEHGRAASSPRLSPKDSSHLTAASASTAELLPVDSSATLAPPSITEHTTRHLDEKKTE
jgi:hypothetical protein